MWQDGRKSPGDVKGSQNSGETSADSNSFSKYLYQTFQTLTVLRLYDSEILGEQCTVKNSNLVDFTINTHEIYCLQHSGIKVSLCSRLFKWINVNSPCQCFYTETKLFKNKHSTKWIPYFLIYLLKIVKSAGGELLPAIIQGPSCYPSLASNQPLWTLANILFAERRCNKNFHCWWNNRLIPIKILITSQILHMVFFHEVLKEFLKAIFLDS